jgi:hypothetical protein
MARTATIDPRKGHLGVTLGLYKGDALSGVRVEKCHPADLFAKAGVQSGGVITHVNAEPVYDHFATMFKFEQLDAPFTVTHVPDPAKAVHATRLKSVKSATVSLIAVVPALITLGSADLSTQLAGGCGVILTLASTIFLNFVDAPQAARAVSFAATFALGVAFVAAAQEIRRCVRCPVSIPRALCASLLRMIRSSHDQDPRSQITSLCDYPTLYGSEADCRAPCLTPYGAWHGPAVGATFLAVAVSINFSWRLNLTIDSADAIFARRSKTE